MRLHRAGLSGWLLTLAACNAEGPVGPRGLCNTPGAVARLDVGAPQRTLLFRSPIRASDTLRLVPVVSSSAGVVRANFPATFTSLDTTVVVVDSFGVVRPRAAGEARVRVAACYERAEVTIQVAPMIASVEIVGGASQLVVGDTLRLVGRALRQTGERVADAQIQWTLTGPASFVSSSDSTAALIALGAGTVVVQASTEGVSAQLTITVLAASFTSVAAGTDFTCATATLDRLNCWGRADVGQLAAAPATTECFDDVSPGGPFACALVPTRVSAPPLVQVDAGARHACAVATSGLVYCWGLNAAGQLGDGTVQTRSSPTPLAGIRVFGSTTVGASHSCALTPAGAAWCWGQDSTGQLGWGRFENSTTPVPVLGNVVFADLSAGGSHTCGIGGSGAAWCWGSNVSGQLGAFTGFGFAGVLLPVSGGLRFFAIAAGLAHTCALSSGGAAYCWGQDSTGQLGRGGTGGSTQTPTAVTGGLAFTAITAGGNHTCAQTSAGTVYCWGSNAYGQLGTGSTNSSGTPTLVAGSIAFRQVDAGSRHTCGVTAEGTAYCWGSGILGALGDEQQANYRDVPVVVGSPR